jgi:hypothetical protein
MPARGPFASEADLAEAHEEGNCHDSTYCPTCRKMRADQFALLERRTKAQRIVSLLMPHASGREVDERAQQLLNRNLV